MNLKNNKLVRYLLLLRTMQRVNLAMARGAATGALRRIDAQDARTWEFSGFSQNGEDGIIEYLLRAVAAPNRYFVEIGSSDGVENNTTWLALAQKYSGVMIEGDATTSAWCRYWLGPLCYGVEIQNMFVNKDDLAPLKSALWHWDPDVFSLDIDGNDFYIVSALLQAGFRPKIAVVEYNSVFGPEQKISVAYDPTFRKREGHGVSLYFGCSVAAWKQLFAGHGYEFVTVDQNGINAFFVDRRAMAGDFTVPQRRQAFQESASHAREYKYAWEQQFALIKGMPFTRF